MSKVVLASYLADTPGNEEHVAKVNKAATDRQQAQPFPAGHAVLPVHWYLVADTDTGQVTATRDVSELYPDQDQHQDGGTQS